MTLSIIMVTHNSADVVEGALKSVAGLWDELLVGDGGSTDGTVEIVKKYGATVVSQRAEAALGVRKQELVEKAKGEWILVLDADERVSGELKEEIASIPHPPRRSHALRLRSGLPPSEVDKGSSASLGTAIAAFRIPYQNYVFGRPVYYGGEKYAKVRLFRKGFARISPEPLHEEIIVKGGKVGVLKGVIHHHSYRTPRQLFVKFTRYAWIAAREKKRQGQAMSVKKLFLYGPHMFWARFVKEKGYRDGWRGLVLALAFGYMEGLTYWFGLAIKLHKVTPCNNCKE